MKKKLMETLLVSLGEESVEGIEEAFKFSFEEYCYGNQNEEDPTMSIEEVDLRKVDNMAILFIQAKENGKDRKFKITISIIEERW